MKRVLVLVLTAAMVFGCTVTASAATSPYDPGHTYYTAVSVKAAVLHVSAESTRYQPDVI